MTAAAASLALLLTSGAAAKTALVVGVNHGLSEDEPLRFAEEDARGVAQALVDVGTVPAEGVRPLLRPHVEQIRRALEEAADGPPRELFVFYFSGHGDLSGAHVNGEVLPWAELASLLSRVPAQRVLAIVDACHSGALLNPKGLVRGPPLTLSVVPLGPVGRFLITSSGSNEASYESTWLQGSPFTHLLISGLRGAADLDGDGRVTLDELYRFLLQRSIAATVGSPSGPQHPSAQADFSGAGEWIIAEVGTRALLSRNRAPFGTCYVLDPDGTRVLAELPPPETKVALAPGAYQVKCLRENQLFVAAVVLPASGLSLDDQRFQPSERTYALAKGPGEVGRNALEVEPSLRIETGWTFAPELSFSYRYERSSVAFEGTVGIDLKNGPILALAGVSLPIPFWNVRETRLDLGLLAGCELNPFNGGDFEPALLFGPDLRLRIPLDRWLSFILQPTILTRVPFSQTAPSAVGLLTLGLVWELDGK